MECSIVMFNMAVAPLTSPSTPSSAVLARLWAFTRNISSDTIKSATAWWGDPALNQLTAQRLLGEFPAVGSSSGETEMGRARWRYTVKIENTDFEDLRQINVSVAFADKPEQVVTTISGFLGRATRQKAAPGNQGTDWAPLEVAR